MRLSSAVMFVSELDRSCKFYENLLGATVTVRTESSALLVEAERYQLYLRAMGERVNHPLGSVGIQYLIWSAADEADLRRCEIALRAQSSHVTRETVDGFTIVEGLGPDGVPVLITHPGPEDLPRDAIIPRIYEW